MPRAKSADPKRNAGISLTQSEIDELDKYKEEAGLESRSQVVSLLIKNKMPELWADWLRSQP